MTLDLVRSIIETSPYGTLATTVEQQPHVRPMAFGLLGDGRLGSSTCRVSGKVRELEHNARVEVCFVSKDNRQVRIEGRLDISGGPDKKRKLLELNPRVKRHFADENDAKFVHLEVVPTRIRWKGMGFCEYNEVALPG